MQQLSSVLISDNSTHFKEEPLYHLRHLSCIKICLLFPFSVSGRSADFNQTHDIPRNTNNIPRQKQKQCL